jgi:hypothetical protein
MSFYNEAYPIPFYALCLSIFFEANIAPASIPSSPDTHLTAPLSAFGQLSVDSCRRSWHLPCSLFKVYNFPSRFPKRFPQVSLLLLRPVCIPWAAGVVAFRIVVFGCVGFVGHGLLSFLFPKTVFRTLCQTRSMTR